MVEIILKNHCGNLYVMPIYDAQNHIYRVFIINIESHAKCNQNMSNIASCIEKFSILCMKMPICYCLQQALHMNTLQSGI